MLQANPLAACALPRCEEAVNGLKLLKEHAEFSVVAQCCSDHRCESFTGPVACVDADHGRFIGCQILQESSHDVSRCVVAPLSVPTQDPLHFVYSGLAVEVAAFHAKLREEPGGVEQLNCQWRIWRQLDVFSDREKLDIPSVLARDSLNVNGEFALRGELALRVEHKDALGCVF